MMNKVILRYSLCIAIERCVKYCFILQFILYQSTRVHTTFSHHGSTRDVQVKWKWNGLLDKEKQKILLTVIMCEFAEKAVWTKFDKRLNCTKFDNRLTVEISSPLDNILLSNFSRLCLDESSRRVFPMTSLFADKCSAWIFLLVTLSWRQSGNILCWLHYFNLIILTTIFFNFLF